MNAQHRTNEASIEVICLGLGRTGTFSLGKALEMLGLGPFYHMINILDNKRTEDFRTWTKISEGRGSVEDLDRMFRGYKSILDYPAANYPKELYEAYPNAKFIITVRDTEKWEKSMRSTLIPFNASLASAQPTELPPTLAALTEWWESYGPCGTKQRERNLQTQFIRHTEYVKSIIPADQLLVYNVGEGWKRLVEFLGVPEPLVPFPHVNDAEEYKNIHLKSAAAR